MRSKTLGRQAQFRRRRLTIMDPEAFLGKTKTRSWKRGSPARDETCLQANETSATGDPNGIDREPVAAGRSQPCGPCAGRLELCATIIIRALFVVFNVLYWPVLMSKSEYNRKLYSMHETGWLDDLVAEILPSEEQGH